MQTLPSSQPGGGPPVHAPAEQRSSVVHASSSLQGAVLFRWRQPSRGRSDRPCTDSRRRSSEGAPAGAVRASVVRRAGISIVGKRILGMDAPGGPIATVARADVAVVAAQRRAPGALLPSIGPVSCRRSRRCRPPCWPHGAAAVGVAAIIGAEILVVAVGRRDRRRTRRRAAVGRRTHCRRHDAVLSAWDASLLPVASVVRARIAVVAGPGSAGDARSAGARVPGGARAAVAAPRSRGAEQIERAERAQPRAALGLIAQVGGRPADGARCRRDAHAPPAPPQTSAVQVPIVRARGAGRLERALARGGSRARNRRDQESRPDDHRGSAGLEAGRSPRRDATLARRNGIHALELAPPFSTRRGGHR